MIDIREATNGYQSAESRWSRFGPYYAMFPVDFAFDVINRYSRPGDYVLDPFAGRSSSIYAGGVLGRYSLGIEINPVGWIYGNVKLNPADKLDVIDRLSEIHSKRNYFGRSILKMPEFYRICYCDEVLKFLLAARKYLDWENNIIDATLMSIILVYLHGKIGEGLSNQMRMTKSMGMNYSINWWKTNGFTEPPQINPRELLLKKINWRYEKGTPRLSDSAVIFGDSCIELPKISERANENGIEFSLLFTSPPYYSITDYHADQWLRLWMLGDRIKPKKKSQKYKGRFESRTDYKDLLFNVFKTSSTFMKDDAVIYVRTDRRNFTFDTTLTVLKECFPKHTPEIIERPIHSNTRTQTKLFGDKTLKPGEVDIIMKK